MTSLLEAMRLAGVAESEIARISASADPWTQAVNYLHSAFKNRELRPKLEALQLIEKYLRSNS
ncbi:hypothetical protein GKIL_1767 [Gloeobacter kilaueensis JS1]|uniref:Uncharacterized protein n=1 Tax=Gloeobacter kilaueensis (strain ATCC BAA-2537 / CCAP 1431/1 / ULC 316 / JS1) TaxID=1183438 RepID=U5QGL2_GLOK1|nr:hypothetical protein GKIL_1767 [Gloeobacter kilaueensis JS1]